MARRKEGQPEVHIQQFYDPVTPRVQKEARPYGVTPQGKPPDMTGAIMSQSVMQMSQAATNLLGFISDRQERRGVQAALAGEDRPERASDAFIRGYERYNAMAKVNEYSRAIHDLYMNSGDMTVEEFIEARSEVEAEFLIGATEEFQRGFVPKASEIANRYDKKVIEDQHSRLVHDHIADTRQRMEAEVSLVMGMSLEDPSLNVGKELRNRLTQVQEDSKPLKLVHRNEVSKQAVQVVGRHAIETANPDLILDFVSEVDDSGFALRHNPEFGEMALNYYYNAVRAEEAQRKLLAQQEAEEHKKMVEAFEKILIENLEDGTPEALQQARKLLSDWGPDISPATYHRYLTRLHDQQDTAYFARSSNPQMYDFFHSLAIRGEFTPELRDIGHHVLDKDDFIDLIKMSNNSLLAKQEAGPGPTRWFNDAKASAMNVAMASGADDPLGRFMDQVGAVERGFLIDNIMNQWFSNRIRTGTYGTVTWEEINDVAEQAVDKAVRLFPIQTIYRGVRGSEEQSQYTAPGTPDQHAQDERNALRFELEREMKGER